MSTMIATPAESPQIERSEPNDELFNYQVKKMITIRLDPDVLDHFRSQGPGYQTRINDFLRAVMEQELAAKQPPPRLAGLQ